MLSRIPLSLPSATVSATVARSTTSYLHRLPACTRFNSSEAAAPEASEPKKRGVPLAQDLGGIRINKRREPGAPRPNGSQRQQGNGEQQYQAFAPRNNAQGNFRPSGDRNENRQGSFRPSGDSAGSRRPRPVDGDRIQSPRRMRTNDNRSQNGQEWARQTEAAQREPGEPGDEQAEHVEGAENTEATQARDNKNSSKEKRAHLPIPETRVELGNLDDLFGPPTTIAPQQTSQTVSRSSLVSPSEARLQLILENTAGDYTRFVPRPAPTTDVKKLGAVGLGGFVLSHNRDVGLKSRQNAVTVIEKFAGGKGAQVTSS